MPQRRSNRKLWSEAIARGNVGQLGAQEVAQARKPFTGTILGVDPSLRGTGLAVVNFGPGEQLRLLASRTVKPPRTLKMPECLKMIAKSVNELLERYDITCAAFEEAIFVQNVKTALVLGAARGAAMACVSMRELPLFEYAPLRIKQAVTGRGRASKVQVASMIQNLLSLPEPLPSDESDAAAVAICHAYTSGKPSIT